MRRLHYSIHTERTYCAWVEQFVRFHKIQLREALLRAGSAEIEAFSTSFAVERKVAASTQNQALDALVYLVQEGTGGSLGRMYRYCLIGQRASGAGSSDAWVSIMIPANRVRSAQRTLPNYLRRRVRCADRPRCGAAMEIMKTRIPPVFHATATLPT